MRTTTWPRTGKDHRHILNARDYTVWLLSAESKLNVKTYGTEYDCKIAILIQQNVLIICSSSLYLPSLDLVQRESVFFFGDITRTLTTGVLRHVATLAGVQEGNSELSFNTCVTASKSERNIETLIIVL